MTPALIPAATLVAVTLVGFLALRSFSYRVRLAFDAVCFLAISTFLLKQEISPFFAPLQHVPDSTSLWLRVICGAWWLLGARIIVAALRFFFDRDQRSRETRLFSDLAAATIYIAAALIMLNSTFSLPVAGLLATSGVLAIVLGLALQNTLADVFAGIAVGTEAPFGVGDHIQIGEKIEGVVVQVNWRSIRIETDDECVAIIPNSLVAKGEIINRSFPSRRRRISIELSCPSESAPELVEEKLLQATLLCPSILQDPPPSATLKRLGLRRNLYTTTFFVVDSDLVTSTKSALLQHARRQLHYAGLLSETPGMNGPVGWNVRPVAISGYQILRDIVLFDCLTDQQIAVLANQLKLRSLEHGDVLFTQEAPDSTLYVIASGVLEITRQMETVTQTLGCLGAGAYVGEIGLLTGAPRAATATARTRCQVYQLSHEAIAPLLSKNPDLAFAFDKAVRLGLEILHREVAARAAESIGVRGQLLNRIRGFFLSAGKAAKP